jgi:hypothetical protein
VLEILLCAASAAQRPDFFLVLKNTRKSVHTMFCTNAYYLIMGKKARGVLI